MRKRLTYVLLLLIVVATPTHAQRLTAMRDSVAGAYHFWFYEPASKVSPNDTQNVINPSDLALSEKPLFVFLHGASLQGSNLQRVRKYGTINAIDKGMNIDAYVIAPQTRNGWDATKVWSLIDWAKAHYDIDTNRIYVLGMSLGGFGTYNVASKYYDKIAAAMMICGGATGRDWCGLCKMPFWLLHGTADRVVPLSRSQEIANGMKECGDTSRLIFTKLRGMDHGDPARVFYLRETYLWLLAHSLTDDKRKVDRSYEITATTLKNPYYWLPRQNTSLVVVNRAAQTQSSSQVTETDDNETPDVYIIKRGDNLIAIARRFHTTVEKICKLNNIKNPDYIREGQKIKLK
ncbi:MAG: LysM peptidoglycan-binding domain-containing protein [Paludibacteraceae bacterium]|nr:LysM peptidoglycan-binding domain-containing protein [Paludibacteraceae bacterium]